MGELIKNSVHTALVTGYSSQGYGVCRIGDRAVFVPGAMEGEEWELLIVKTSASAVYGKGLRCLAPSPHRIEAPCAHYGRCGGCGLMHMDYDEELRFKLQRVNDALCRLGGLQGDIGTILGARSRFAYRNKCIFSVGAGPCRGFFRPRSHDIVPISRCLIQPEAADRAADAVCRWMQARGVPAYDERSGSGLVRHVFTRTAFSTGQLMVCLVCARRPEAADLAALPPLLRRACPQLGSLVLNINSSRGNTVLAGSFHTIWGQDYLEDRLCSFSFRLAPQAFFQINPPQAERLYEKAVEYAAPDGGTVLDLYCGAGAISLCLARRADRVIGAELVPQAVDNARENAARNGVRNAEFICADASGAAARLAGSGLRPDSVVVDPPRKGLAPEVIDAIAAMAPPRLVYVSCDPATLARDLRLFTRQGYRFVTGCAVDMFPCTSHVETVVLLSQQKPKDQIVVDLDLSELDLTSAEAKATYREIQDYVLKRYGLKVSNLYVSQIKRKCGLEMGQNYNLSKSDNARVPICPPEKEAAIMDALRHFKMI